MHYHHYFPSTYQMQTQETTLCILDRAFLNSGWAAGFTAIKGLPKWRKKYTYDEKNTFAREAKIADTSSNTSFTCGSLTREWDHFGSTNFFGIKVLLEEVALTLPSSSPGGEGGPRNHYDTSNWVIRARAIDRKRPSSGGEHY